jgi:hypothetical protein
VESKIYFCSHCKKILKSVEELYFVEDGVNRGFCSEQCIEDFFTPIVAYFEKSEKSLRGKWSLNDEPCLSYIGDPTYMNQLIHYPTEVWATSNDLTESYYTFIKELKDSKDQKFYMFMICSIFQDKASFIFMASATYSNDYLNEFRVGTKEDDVTAFIEEQMDEREIAEASEFNTEVENKKSQLLAKLLEDRSPADIPFEQFPLYDEYLQDTLKAPDEVYTHQDDDGDTVYTYIKAHDRNGTSFYYFIICVQILGIEGDNEKTVTPVLTFPSVDGELYKTYRKGEQLSGSLKS